MNLSTLINLKVKEFEQRFPDYSYCDVIFSAVRVHFKGVEMTKMSLMNLTDDEYYKALCKAFEREKIKHSKYYKND